MALAINYSRANVGVEAPLVTVEAHLSGGLPGFSIVGLPETVVKESKDRVRSAILNAGFEFPVRRITVNLAPADLPKGGGRFDLAIALGILVASRQLKCKAEDLQRYEFLGELALSGEVRAVAGLIPGLIACRRQGRQAIVPGENISEAGLLADQEIYLASHLLEVCTMLQGEQDLPRAEVSTLPEPESGADMSDVSGQLQARRALLIAAAGGHNLLFRGPPGTGKTLLASRLPGILPRLSREQSLEVAAIRSISGEQKMAANWSAAPFRAPHHTASAVALVGGGSTFNPGEISLAHHGVLFLDELPEFSPRVLEVMREPLEKGQVMISRASYQVCLPARFQLIAAMNPCPCGYFGDNSRACQCSPQRISNYQQRISGPLLDRIDLHVEVPRLSREEQKELGCLSRKPPPDSTTLRGKVEACQARQLARQGKKNAWLNERELREVCRLDNECVKLLDDASQKLQLSIRAYFRLLKIARTIADLDACDSIDSRHVMEAISYRQLQPANL